MPIVNRLGGIFDKDGKAKQAGGIFDKDGLAPTLTDMQGGYRQPLIIKNATIQGYQEAYEGDSVNLSYPNSNTRRGRVGNQVSQTLQCNDSMGVIENTRIRKLTPRECFRLMGFTDEEFDKVSVGISNTQLYKMARKFNCCKCAS